MQTSARMCRTVKDVEIISNYLSIYSEYYSTRFQYAGSWTRGLQGKNSDQGKLNAGVVAYVGPAAPYAVRDPTIMEKIIMPTKINSQCPPTSMKLVHSKFPTL
jgi:hypothetical protein